MSQRLIKVSSKKRTPIGITSKGVAVFAISGADPGDDDNDSGEAGDGGDADADGGGDGSEGQNQNGDGDANTGNGDAPKTYSADEYAALQKRMQAADKTASAAQAALKKIEDAKKDDLTKATEKVSEHEQTIAAKDEEISNLRFGNAFALDSTFVWHDPEVVLTLVRQRPEITVGDDGKISGLQAALKALAKDKPFLVKKENSDDAKPPKSGSTVGAKGTKTVPKKDDAALRRKYNV